MIKLICMSDFTEQYASNLLRGILRYSQETSPWVICKMPPEFKREKGLQGVVSWAKAWKANAIIGQFESSDDLTLFRKNHIVVIAQDYKQRFDYVPNITSNYAEAGRMAAEFYVNKGFHNFAFYGYKDVVWSDERLAGFRDYLESHGLGDRLMTCCRQSIDQLWFYHSEPLSHWLSQLPHSTALFAADDTMSRKIVEQCHVLGLNIPYDVSVLGVDNDEISCLLSYPELSSMEMDVQQAGYEAAMLIEKMMNDPGYEGHDIYVKTIGVVERNSTNYFAAKNVYIRETLKYIFEHLADIRTIADLVEKLPMSRRVFEKRFYEEMKTTPYSYICKMRMERLAQLLITSDDSIDNLCERVGGLNSKNLSRQFKKYMGMTPVEYRNKYKKT